MKRDAQRILRLLAMAAPLALPAAASAQSPGPSAGEPLRSTPSATGSLVGGVGTGKTALQMSRSIMDRGLSPAAVKHTRRSHGRSLRYRRPESSWDVQNGIANAGGAIYESPPAGTAQTQPQPEVQPPRPGGYQARPTATGGDASSGNIRDQAARPKGGLPGATAGTAQSGTLPRGAVQK